MTLRFLNYNNYFDRTIKRPNDSDLLSGYNPYLLFTMTDIDFNPNDGITTEVILQDFNEVLNVEPNYLLVHEHTSVYPTSRWFIMEIKRLRGRQWRVTLKRDIIIDNLNTVLTAPCYVEKGWLNWNNPLIFNPESVNVNQVKKREYLLKDQTQVAWICGYYNKYESSDNFTPSELKANFQTTPVEGFDYGVDGLSSWAYYSYLNNEQYSSTDLKDKTEVAYKLYNYFDDGLFITEYSKDIYCKKNGATYVDIKPIDANYLTAGWYINSSTAGHEYQVLLEHTVTSFNGLNAELTNSIISNSINKSWVNYATFNNLRSLENKIVYDSSTSKFYKVVIHTDIKTLDGALNPTSELGTKMADFADDIISLTRRDENPNLVNAMIYKITDIPTVTISLEETGDQSNKHLIFSNMELIDGSKMSTRIHTNDAPYDMFCMPYNPDTKETYIYFYNEAGDTLLGNIKINNTTQKLAAMAICAQNNVYDLQLLPYCPLANVTWDANLGSNGALRIKGRPATSNTCNPFYGYIHTPLSSGATEVNLDQIDGIVFNSEQSSFSGKIYGVDIESPIVDPKLRKVEIMTKITRICSPNYASVFEFNKQMNDGVSYWEYNCTYKPYTPYIQINPNWGGLYNKDFNDQRGLICAGQFSLPSVKEEFAQFELQNKNYQLSFQRGINRQTFYNAWDNYDMWLNAKSEFAGGVAGGILGLLGGASQGETGSALVNSVSGLVKTGARAWANQQDISIAQKKQDYEINYQKQMFNLEVGNIKARPDTLTNVGTFDINNKIFPFVEEYGTTSEEYHACGELIDYHGMTIGILGKLWDYINFNYVGVLQPLRGKIIRLNTDNDACFDTHQAQEIYNEISNGIYLLLETEVE